MGLFSEMKQRGIWRGYERHVVELEPILVRMSKRGIPVDPTAFADVKATLTKEVEAARAEMQRLVPFEVKVKTVYKKKPKKNLEECVCIDGVWQRPKPWAPSSKGLIRYMQYRGHPVPKALKTDRDTTNKLELERLAKNTGDSLYFKVLEYRRAATILDNHMENWQPGPDGCVHPVFYFDPATGQLSSRRPNAQNAPKHGELAKLFRSMVKAPDGYTIMEFDYKAFHVQTLGFEARDLDMMRMGRLDIHSFVTAHFLKLGEADALFQWKDDELRDYLAWVKKNHKATRDAKVKHALLGYNNGMGYTKLYKQYMEFFENQGEAKRVLQLLDRLFPKAKAYRDNICQQAHEQGYLISRHGYIRWFWEVFRWQGGRWSHGDDHEAALCFFTQNDAHGELKDRIHIIGDQSLDEKYKFIDNIHDSMVFCCPTKLVEEAHHTVKAIMEKPSEILVDPVVAPTGLSVEVDVQAGPDWAHMKGI